jgi:hypothetical protein
VTRLAWSIVGERFYEAGIDRGVLYVGSNPGVVWNGLVSVNESPSGGEARSYYVDGVKYLHLSAKEEFEATLEAFYSPPEFDVCDGVATIQLGLFATQQSRKSFGLSYRTKIGNDVNGNAHAYKLHIVMNALAEPSQRDYATIDDASEAGLLSWSIKTKPSLISGVGYSAHLVVDTSIAPTDAVKNLEDILYGDEANAPRLPTVAEIIDVFIDASPVTVTDIGSDQFTISGSDLAVSMVDVNTYTITSNAIIEIDEHTAQISSE